MPAIKKKWIKASHDDESMKDTGDVADTEDSTGDDDAEVVDSSPSKQTSSPPKQKARTQPPGLLKGLDGEVLAEKRKRFVPPAEFKLAEWIDNNLEKRTQETIHLPMLYTYYTELCQGDASDILDVPAFNRMIKQKFGKAFGLKENSVYKAVIKEKKIQDKKAGGTGIKMKPLIHEAINNFGNPWQGVRFFTLKRFIGTKYPALQIEQKPNLLKRSLETGVKFGQLDLVKGIGKAGYYKIPGGEPPKPTPKPKGKDAKQDDQNDDAEKGKDDDEPKDEKEDGKDEKKAESSAEEKSGKEENAEGAKQKQQKAKKPQTWSYSKMSFSNPSKVEDVFPLAITYQSAPKVVGVSRIRRYVQDKYGETVPDNRLRKALETGATKGYWEHASGSGLQGKLFLLMDDFNPGSKQIEDMICAAIIACHEPKSASASQIKKYVSQYHTEFGVDERPDKFKKALQRALDKGMLVQLSGLGANGSFQLSRPFTPSPAMLAGDDDSEEEADDSEDGVKPAYVPRGTKSRGMPKVKTMEAVPSKPAKKGRGKKPAAGRSSAQKRKAKYSSDEEEEEEEVKPKKKAKKAAAPKGRPGSSAKKSKSKQAEGDSEVEEALPEYTPRKSKSRGGPQMPASQASKGKAVKSSTQNGKDKPKVSEKPPKKEATATPTPPTPPTPPKKPAAAKKGRSSTASPSETKPEAEPSDIVEEEVAPDYTPRRSKSRGGSETPTTPSSKKKKGRK